MCPLPWMQLSILPDGRIRLCCHSKTSNINKTKKTTSFYIQKNPLEDILNSDWINQIKNEFIKGRIPQACAYCFSQHTHHSERPADYYRKSFGAPDELFESKAPKIKYLDLSLTRNCNLQCLMCSPKFSSALDSLYQRPMKHRGPHHPFGPEFIESEDFDFLTKNLETILFQGGEPFLSPLHGPILRKLVETGRSSDITINYITNGTILPRPEILELWRNFSGVKVEVSLDDIEERAEYIRHPLKWSKFKENFQEFSFLSESGLLSLDTTLTFQVLNMFALPRVFSFLKNYNVVSRVPIINILEHPQFLNYRWLPVFTKERSKNQLDRILKTKKLTELETQRVQFLQSKLMERQTGDLSALKSDFIIHLKRTKSLRGDSTRHVKSINDVMDYINS